MFCRTYSSTFKKTINVLHKCYISLPPSSTQGIKSKSNKMASSIEYYLQNVQAYENMLEEERLKFENGKKYLARMMGQDPNTFDQSAIDEAIQYFFPSGLMSRKGFPKLKPPEEIFPKKKQLQFDKTGRPFQDFFYTGRPAFYDLMHKSSLEYEELNLKFDRAYIEHDFTYFKNSKVLILASSDWISKDELSKKLLESITDVMYDNWIKLMNAIVDHPLSWNAEAFIFSYRVSGKTLNTEYRAPEPILDPTTNRKYVDSFGQKKHAFVELRMFHPGSGRMKMNGKNLLEMFPELGNREQIMFPLQFTGMLGAVDVEAKIADTETGSSSKANALRLALSRALSSFLPSDLGAHRLRAAGLLTQDDRFSERKKPGQKKARKKPIWKAR